MHAVSTTPTTARATTHAPTQAPADPNALAHLLARYGAEPFDHTRCSDYVQWALELFNNPELSHDPYLQITLQLDITCARTNYQRHFAQAPGASLTAFLTWSLLRVLPQHPAFLLRCVAGSWYVMRQSPLFFPVALDARERFGAVLLEGALGAAWESFAQRYRAGIERARQAPWRQTAVTGTQYYLATFIGNLPALRFTSLQRHVDQRHWAAPYFYFGQRYEQGDRYLLPLSVSMHHGTTDPLLLNLLLSDYSAQLGAE